ncbi:MAG: phosphomannomutase/phosphoglucomutase [Actinobacteria bacterium]|nr:phosphomannomutase/phosphoglucomutase [Actinomycetota bacterium]MDA2984270.1 phosphomannomutase/phosphoglucomutase [Actinomycetota bacterium]
MIKVEVAERIIKAYDIRGLVGSEINEEFCFATGSAFARFLELEREPSTILIGEDMRPSSQSLATAFSDGVMSQGFDVIRIGLASTDQLYFASGSLNFPGAMFTASHNPAQYNGIKLCKSGARPVGQDSGLNWIKNSILSGMPIVNRPPGIERSEDLLDKYVDYLFSLFDLDFSTGRELNIVIDAGNGMAGHTAPEVFKRISGRKTELFFELDGNFPNHEANPIDPKNLRDLQKTVLKKRADIGLAFDGDADRCFLIDENGALVSPSALTALIASIELEKDPGAKIIYNLISSKAVPEIIEEQGGVALRSRVGHSFIKKLMADSGAIFGGEHSGHFYFAKFWCADSGMLAALYALAALKNSDKNLSEILQPFNRYSQSGEINIEVTDVGEAIAKVRILFPTPDFEHDELDGVTISSQAWWLNLRPSNTEPLLRLNVEADKLADMEKIRDRVLDLFG